MTEEVAAAPTSTIPWHLCGSWILSFLGTSEMVPCGGLCRSQTESESLWHGLAVHLGVSGLPTPHVRRWKRLRSTVCPRRAFVKRLVEQTRTKSRRDHQCMLQLWRLIRAGEVGVDKLRHFLSPSRAAAPLLARGMDPDFTTSELNAANPAVNACAQYGRLRTLRALQVRTLASLKSQCERQQNRLFGPSRCEPIFYCR